MKQIVAFLALFVFLFVSIPSAEAKVLPQAKSQKATGKAVTSSSITVSPRLRADRKALLVSFGNLQNATSVSYTLTYTHDGQEEGAGGSVNPADGNTASRELLFGTCSSGVCRYHSGISNMKFEVTAQLKSGKKIVKRYRIRV